MSDRVFEIILKIIFFLTLIGVAAILFLPFMAEAQTHIHRSIQNNTSAIATSGGTITFTITGDTIATFSADMPDSVGRGCAIEYDSTGSSSIKAIAFIKYRTSKRVFGVQRFQGGNPSPASATTTWNIFHAYVTWEKLHNGDENDGINNTVENFDAHTDGVNIDARSQYWEVAMYAGAHDLTGTQGGDDINTSPTEKLVIYAPCGTKYVGVSQRHAGKLTYRGAVFTASGQGQWLSNDDIGTAVCNDVNIIGMQWDLTGVGARDAFEVRGSSGTDIQNFLIQDCIFHGSDSVSTNTTSHAAITWASGVASNGGMVRIRNNLFYGWKTAATTTNEGAILFTSVNIADSMMVHSNTIYRCQDGVKRTNAGNILTVRNTITNRCADGFNGGIGGTFNTSDISSDCGSCTNMNTGTVAFTAISTGDFTLHSSDAKAINLGTNAAVGSLLAPTTDLKNFARAGTMDVGAFDQNSVLSGCAVEADPPAATSNNRRRAIIQ